MSKDGTFSGPSMCAFESAATKNPDYTVMVLLQTESNIETYPVHLRKFENVHFAKADMETLVRGTPVEKLWQSGRVTYAMHAVVNVRCVYNGCAFSSYSAALFLSLTYLYLHVKCFLKNLALNLLFSDMLRLIVLYKCGGVYFDLDVISREPIPNNENFLVQLTEQLLNNAILKFGQKHAFIDLTLREMVNKLFSYS